MDVDTFTASNTPSPVSSSESTDRSVKRPRVLKPKPKTAVHNMDMVKLSLLQQVHKIVATSTPDYEKLFGQQEASELRAIKDRALQSRPLLHCMHPYQGQPTPPRLPGPINPVNVFHENA